MIRPRAVVLSLGSNHGNRLVNLRRGMSAASSVIRFTRVSSVWETSPLGCAPGTGPFLNLVAEGWTHDDAPGLLVSLREIEASLGRRASQRNSPRRLDIDIVWMEGISLTRGEVLVPHPRFRERAFVLEPLREIGFSRYDAASGTHIAAMTGQGLVRRVARLW